MMPTRLGNTIQSAESYGLATYGMDMPFWWPKLWALLPEGEQHAVTDALTGLMVLISMGVALLYNGIDSAIYLLRQMRGWALFWVLLPLALSWLLAWFCYEGAIVRARSYGQRLRTGVDLHRFDLLKALHQPLPKTPLEERDLWKWLTDWAYSGVVGPAYSKAYDHGEAAPEAVTPAQKETNWIDKLFEWLKKLLE